MPEFPGKHRCRRVAAATLVIAPMLIAAGCEKPPSTPPSVPKPQTGLELPAMSVQNGVAGSAAHGK
jgi:hypothetical protein